MASSLLSDYLSGVDSREPGTVFIGLDGYVDTIQKVVRSRTREGPTYFTSIRAFGERILQAEGMSSQLEVETVVVKAGGNGPLMAGALTALGFDVTCMGTLGWPRAQEHFEEAAHTLLTVGEPSMSTALEFEDGKIIISDLERINSLTWQEMLDRQGLPAMQAATRGRSLMAFVGLANLPHCIELLKGFQQEVLCGDDIKSQFFFDIADPGRMSADNLRKLIRVIADFGSLGPVTLGINENEARQLYGVICRQSADAVALAQIGAALYEAIDIDDLLIHPLHRALSYSADGFSEAAGYVVTRSKVQTGAGDHFNAGYCLAAALGRDRRSRLVVAMASSGYYVAHGRSARPAELNDFILQHYSEVD